MNNSWIHLKENKSDFQLSEDDKQLDQINAIDCGWVEQMRPFIKQFSRPGELVLDPFCGFASTLVAAEIEGRRSIGIEVDEDRVKLSQQRLNKLNLSKSTVVQGDAQQQAGLIKNVDLILTNLPYFACSWQNSDSNQLYNAQSYEQYLQKLRDCFKEFKKTLKYSGYFVLALENIRIGDHFVPLAMDVLNLLKERFHFIDERVLVYDKKNTNENTVLSNRSHEYVFIAQNIEKAIDHAKSKAVLDELNKLCPDLIVFGSFAPWLLQSDAKPSDVDILLPYDAWIITKVSEWFRSNGFKISRWGSPVDKESISSVILVSNYLRAERLDSNGALILFDICFTKEVDVYKNMLAESVLVDGIKCLKEKVQF